MTLGFAACLFASVCAADNERFLLRLSAKPAEAFVTDVVLDTALRCASGGYHENELTQVLWSVQNIDAQGRIALAVQPRRKAGSNMIKGRLQFAFDTKTDRWLGDSRMMAALKAEANRALGTNSRMVLDPRGRLIDAEASGVTSRDIENALEMEFSMFPEEPVAQGSTWNYGERELVTPFVGGKLRMSARLERVLDLGGERVAIIKLSGTLVPGSERTLSGPAPNIEQFDMNGEMMFSLRRGRTIWDERLMVVRFKLRGERGQEQCEGRLRTVTGEVQPSLPEAISGALQVEELPQWLNSSQRQSAVRFARVYEKEPTPKALVVCIDWANSTADELIMRHSYTGTSEGMALKALQRLLFHKCEEEITNEKPCSCQVADVQAR